MNEPAASSTPHVVVLGGGFAGLTFCQHLRGPARVTLVDRENHHLFQPLLYQVATAGLSAPEIAAPIRHVLARYRHVRVIMDEATAIDLDQRRVTLAQDTLNYDYLVLAVGGVTWYFGKEHWAKYALGLKTLDDAMAIRRRILTSFEQAETCDNEALRRKLMTIVVIGGGPTGVELAGTCAELTRVVFKRDFRRIDTTQARVLLIEAAPRVLTPYPEDLSRKAERQLRELGVEVWTDSPVEDIGPDWVRVRGEVLPTANILWGGGVVAHPITRTLGVPLDKAGRVQVLPDLSIPGHPEAFAVGDLAAVVDAEGKPVPGVAPAAMQMGEHVAKLIVDELRRGPRPPEQRPAFRYRDRGIMATIGRSRGVAWLYGRIKLSGFIAWLFVHLVFLIGFRNKLAVLLQWFYSYITFKRGARIIFGYPAAARRTVPADQRQPAASEQQSG